MRGAATVWYFAYGSNMQTATLRGRRGIEYLRAVPARVAGWRLVLDKPPIFPVDEGFANLVAEPGAEVLGVLYELSRDAHAHVELTEGVLIDNYQRIEVRAESLVAPVLSVVAASLTSEKREPGLQPSERYMACLIEGALEHGLPAAYVAWLRALPARPESAEAARLRPLMEEALRQMAVTAKKA